MRVREHRRIPLLRLCRCLRTHSREAWIYYRDERALRHHPGGEAGARIAGWARYQNERLPWADRGVY